MKEFFLTLPQDVINCFKGRKIIWHAVAILVTFLLVETGADRRYFLATRSPALRELMFPAVRVGALLPVVLPLLLILLGMLRRILGGSGWTSLTGWAIAQAEVIGAVIAAAYKALTGRVHPPHATGPDLTHVFRFGLLRGGVFWGWPSSHTTIAFSMAVAVFTLFPKHRWVGYLALVYALYVGIGVSMTIHWFSDFVAGAIFGSVVGVVVGTRFRLLALPAGKTVQAEHSPLPH